MNVREDLVILKKLLWNRQVNDCKSCELRTSRSRAYHLNNPDINCSFCDVLIRNIKEITK